MSLADEIIEQAMVLRRETQARTGSAAGRCAITLRAGEFDALIEEIRTGHFNRTANFGRVEDNGRAPSKMKIAGVMIHRDPPLEGPVWTAARPNHLCVRNKGIPA